MTFQSILPTHPFQGFYNAISRYRAELAEHRRIRAAYNQTFNELSAMSDRDLVDIGLSRGDTARVAKEAAAMN